MKTLSNIKLNIVILLMLSFFACNKDSNNFSNQDLASISIRLQDAPGDFENVFVEIIDVKVKYNIDEGENNWQNLEVISTGVYDLLELTGGVDVLLVDDFEVPAGVLRQIRLILGDDNSVVIDGETYPLSTPSSQQSGLKIQVNERLESNINYTFLLDFDVDKSIVIAGNSETMILKPTLRASLEASSGIIIGNLVPTNIQTEITATAIDDSLTVSAFSEPETGNFALVGLPNGFYTLTITPDINSEFPIQTIENIEVIVGNTTDVGQINLN